MTPEEILERVLDDVARIEYEDNIGKHGHSTPWTAAPEFVRASWRRRAGRLSSVIAKAVAAALPPVAELEAQQRRHEIALGQAWDDGNACGLDGWVGPGRGAGEVDDEAERARERAIEAGLGAPLGDVESNWQDWADDLGEASTRDAFRAGWRAAHGTLTPKGTR